MNTEKETLAHELALEAAGHVSGSPTYHHVLGFYKQYLESIERRLGVTIKLVPVKAKGK